MMNHDIMRIIVTEGFNLLNDKEKMYKFVQEMMVNYPVETVNILDKMENKDQYVHIDFQDGSKYSFYKNDFNVIKGFINGGNKVDAIRKVRTVTGLSLAESKAIVEYITVHCMDL